MDRMEKEMAAQEQQQPQSRDVETEADVPEAPPAAPEAQASVATQGVDDLLDERPPNGLLKPQRRGPPRGSMALQEVPVAGDGQNGEGNGSSGAAATAVPRRRDRGRRPGGTARSTRSAGFGRHPGRGRSPGRKAAKRALKTAAAGPAPWQYGITGSPRCRGWTEWRRKWQLRSSSNRSPATSRQRPTSRRHRPQHPKRRLRSPPRAWTISWT